MKNYLSQTSPQCKTSTVNSVGFVLQHEYSKMTLEPDQLRGSDRTLYSLFASANVDSQKFHIQLVVDYVSVYLPVDFDGHGET